jgi:hypothetical protein
MNTLIAKSLVFAGRTALTLIPSPAKTTRTYTCNQIDISSIELWRTRLEQGLLLLDLLAGQGCECESNWEPGIVCIQCHAHRTLNDEHATAAEVQEAAEAVLCHIDDFGVIDFTGLGEALTFWGSQD